MKMPLLPDRSAAAPTQPLTPEEEADLVRRRDAGDPSARDEMLDRLIPLAQWFAGRRARRPDQVQDGFQEAVMGILRAIEEFDPARGARLGTFAYACIRRALQRARHDRGSLIRVPCNVHIALEADARGRTARLIQPSPPEILAAARRALAVRIASDFVVGRDEADPYDPAALASPEPEDHDGRLDDAEALARLVATLRFLPPGERDVIRLRYGLGDGRGRTLDEVGTEMGFTKQRAGQLERRALGRLRKALGAGGAAA